MNELGTCGWCNRQDALLSKPVVLRLYTNVRQTPAVRWSKNPIKLCGVCRHNFSGLIKYQPKPKKETMSNRPDEEAEAKYEDWKEERDCHNRNCAETKLIESKGVEILEQRD